MTTRVRKELQTQSIFPGSEKERQILDMYCAELGTIVDFINVMKEHSGCSHATAEAIVKAMGEAVSPDGRSLSPEYIKKLLTSANGRLPNNLHRRLKKSELKALDDAMHNFIVWRAFDSLLDTEP